MTLDGLKRYRERVEAGEIEFVQAGPPKNHIQKWREKNTRATAINAFCCQCMGATEDDFSEIRRLVAECSARDCALYAWRPYKETD